MPRRPRNYLPGHTYHIVQRGVNKARTFFQEDDYKKYLDLWTRYSSQHELQVHAYCLMSNHIHFIVSPLLEHSISSTTRQVGSNYARYINRKYSRTGTLWEGRHWSSLIQCEHYLLRCYAYVENNPVRANLVADPCEYPWSSYDLNASADYDWLIPHGEVVNLGRDINKRSATYREIVNARSSAKDIDEITKCVFSNTPLGDRAFCEQLEIKYDIKIQRGKPGRPRKPEKPPPSPI